MVSEFFSLGCLAIECRLLLGGSAVNNWADRPLGASTVDFELDREGGTVQIGALCQ